MKPFILCMGLTGAGKTRTSRLLEEHLEGYARLHTSEILEKKGFPPYSNKLIYDKDRSKLVDFVLFSEMEETIRSGRGVILDKVASKSQVRRVLYDWATENNLGIVVLWHIASESVCKERMAKRPASKNTSIPTNNTAIYDLYARVWQDPKDDLVTYQDSSLLNFDTEECIMKPLKINENYQGLIKNIEAIVIPQ